MTSRKTAVKPRLSVKAQTIAALAAVVGAVAAGLFGLALQWALIPLIVYRAENLGKHEN